MSLIKKILSSTILDRRIAHQTTVVSICGAADLGKSYLSKEIAEVLTKQDLKVNHVTMDSYLIDRPIRKERKLSGYNIEAYDQTRAVEDLVALKNGKSIDLHPYDHREGKTSSNAIKMNPSDILIFDGLHTLHPSFMPHIDIAFFIYTDDDFLKEIRFEADLQKRNYTSDYSKSIAE